ncbi:MAG: 4Fe-4S binding protein [Parcubacteria group bacterium]|jgi:pyruvate ferredoxin oxidoreductase delta subunit
MEKGAIIKHNIKNASPTGSWRNYAPRVDSDKCIGCNTCVKYCPDACIVLKNRKDTKPTKLAEIDLEFCKGCGVCAQVCPAKAIEMK